MTSFGREPKTGLIRPVPGRGARPTRAVRQQAFALGQPQAGPATAVPSYLPGLDGLRAVAVAAVVAYHLGELPGGFLGVDVFFVVSGFLITRLLLAEHERTGRIALGAFWRRRFRRLLPALLVVVAVVAVASRAWLPGYRLPGIRNDAFGALAYMANWRFVQSGQSYFTQGATPSPLRHLWSLAIEEQFYVLWPIVVVGVLALATRLRRPGRRGVGAVALAGALGSALWMAAAAGNGYDLSRVYYGTDTRVFAIFAGAWLASWWDPAVHGATRAVRQRRTRRWATAGSVALVPLGALFALAVTDSARFYRGGFQVAAVVSVVVVAGAATGQGVVARGLAHRSLVWVGRRSYGIYLWSWPTQVLATERFGLGGLQLDLAVVVSILVLASVSYWLVEEPIRRDRRPARLGRWWPAEKRPNRVPQFAAWSAAAVVVVGVLVGSSIDTPPPPTYLTVSDDDVLQAALRPPSAPPLRGRGAPRPGSPATSSPSAIPLAPDEDGPDVSPAPTAPTAAPGPFDPREPLVVDPAADADPAAVHGRPLRVMVAGDSVAWSLGWEVAEGLGEGLETDGRAIIGCGVSPPSARFVMGNGETVAYPESCSLAERSESLGLTGAPDVVLLWLGAWEVFDQEVDGVRYPVGSVGGARLIEAQIQRRIDTYRSVGAATVMPVVPCFGPKAVTRGGLRLEDDRVDWVNERIRQVAARNRGWVRLVDPAELLCDEAGEGRTETPEGIALREDGTHFNVDAATWLWNEWLGGQLASAYGPARVDDARPSGGASGPPGSAVADPPP